MSEITEIRAEIEIIRKRLADTRAELEAMPMPENDRGRGSYPWRYGALDAAADIALDRLTSLIRCIGHITDEDCDVDPETSECRVCRVYHDDPCFECEGRGYHREWCEEVRDG